MQSLAPKFLPYSQNLRRGSKGKCYWSSCSSHLSKPVTGHCQRWDTEITECVCDLFSYFYIMSLQWKCGSVIILFYRWERPSIENDSPKVIQRVNLIHIILHGQLFAQPDFALSLEKISCFQRGNPGVGQRKLLYRSNMIGAQTQHLT